MGCGGVLEQLVTSGECFFKCLFYEVGKGNRIQFWYDHWCGYLSLKDLYLDLFACSIFKEALICDVLLSSLDGGSRSQKLQFQRAFHNCELEDVLAFFKLIYSKLLRGIGVDSLSWSLTRSGTFDVRSFYNCLCGSLIVSVPWKSIWHLKVPIRVLFFIWAVAWGQILTINNHVRGLFLVNWCCMCRRGEMVDHLLLDCMFVHALCSEVFWIFGIQWVMPKKASSLLFGWQNWLGDVWNLVPSCLMWLVWQEYNNHIFEDVEKPIDHLKSLLI